MKQSDDPREGPIGPAPCAGLRSGSRPAGARRAGGPVCHLLCERTCLARQQTWPYLWPRVLSLPMTDAAERHKPLRGRRVLIAASPHTAAVLAERIEQLGGRVELFPALEIRPLGDTSALDAAIEELERYEWIVFTSGYGV